MARLETVLQTKEIAYHKIFQALGNNATRTTLCEGTIQRLALEKEEHRTSKEKLQKERSLKLHEYKVETITHRILFGLSIFAFLLIFGVLLFGFRIPVSELIMQKGVWWLITLFVLDITYFIYWNWQRHSGYIDLNERYLSQITAEEQAVQQRTHLIGVFKLQTHVAGMIIDSLAQLFHNLHSKYNSMRSFVGNLKGWREEETQQVMKDDVREPFLSLISNACLDRYFDTCKDAITANIRLDRMFRDAYHVEEEEVIRFKNNLKQTLVKELFAKLEGFSIYRHIVGERTFDYVERDYTNLDTLLQQMDLKSNHFVRTESTAETLESQNASCKLLFIDTDFQANRQQWKAICDKNFQVAPNLCSDSSPFKMTLLRLNALEPKEIAILKLKV